LLTTDVGRDRGQIPLPWQEMLVGLAVFVSACVAIWLTRVPGGITLFWPSNAIAAALLIRFPHLRCGRTALAVYVALMLAAILAAHRPWAPAAIFGLVNLAEIALMVTAFRFIRVAPYPNITVSHAALMTAVFGIAIPGLIAVIGGLLLHTVLGLAWGQSTLQWWSSHAIGACLVGPPIILFSVEGLKRLLIGRFGAQNALAALVSLIACYLTVRYVRFPFVTMGLLLLVMAFQVGGFGASIMSAAFGLVITNLWILGIRPLGLDPSVTTTGTLIGFPIVALLATVMPPIAVGLGSDARRAAVRALRLSERRFRESMEHSPIGMLLSDTNGVWGYTNRALQQMLGYSAEEFRALPPGGPSKEEDWQSSRERWGELLRNERESYDVVRSFRHKNGHWVWTHVAVSVLRDENGKPQHLIAQIESLEARKSAEERLAAERERLNITLASISDAVITTDGAMCIGYVNAAAEALLGLDAKAATGRRVDEVLYLMDPQSSKAAANLIGQSALHGKVFRRSEPCLLHLPDGSIRYVTDTVSPVLESTGAVSGFVIVFHDATLEVDRSRDLKHRALHDPLTNLSNRADFEQRLHTVFAKARQLNQTAAVIAIDLDRFKAVNDAAGHAAGDALLCKVAEICRAAARFSDTAARLGGDEFALLLDNCTAARARDIGERLVQALNPLTVEWEGTNYTIGASLGLALSSLEIPSEHAWLKLADAACYEAKREGRGLLRIATATQAGEPLARHG
jgi:diguanylate cyclase